MTATRGERLRSARERLFKSARAAAIALGIPSATYGAHERAEAAEGRGRDYGPEEAAIYGARFKVRPEWLLTGSGPEIESEHLDKLTIAIQKNTEAIEKLRLFVIALHHLTAEEANRRGYQDFARQLIAKSLSRPAFEPEIPSIMADLRQLSPKAVDLPLGAEAKWIPQILAEIREALIGGSTQGFDPLAFKPPPQKR
jgi:hypothetical protein